MVVVDHLYNMASNFIATCLLKRVIPLCKTIHCLWDIIVAEYG
jgi:hypothetical protein